MARGTGRGGRLLRSISLDRQREHLEGFLGSAGFGGVKTAALLVAGAKEPHADERVRCELDRYSFFDGRLSVAGRIISEAGQVIGIGIRIPGRRWTWLEPGFRPSHNPC